jgi:hypothetical protein
MLFPVSTDVESDSCGIYVISPKRVLQSADRMSATGLWADEPDFQYEPRMLCRTAQHLHDCAAGCRLTGLLRRQVLPESPERQALRLRQEHAKPCESSSVSLCACTAASAGPDTFHSNAYSAYSVTHRPHIAWLGASYTLCAIGKRTSMKCCDRFCRRYSVYVPLQTGCPMVCSNCAFQMR